MNIQNNKIGKPLEHYTALFAASEPEELARRSGFPYENGAFSLTLLSRRVLVRHPSMEPVAADTGAALSPSTRILLGRFLLEGTALPATGRFPAYSQLPWGSVYNAQFTARCIRRLSAMYGTDIPRFCAACEALGGKRISGADAAYELEFMDGLFIRLLLWEGDEEFPASAQILFSDNFSAAFTAEDIAVVGDTLLNAMRGKW